MGNKRGHTMRWKRALEITAATGKRSSASDTPRTHARPQPAAGKVRGFAIPLLIAIVTPLFASGARAHPGGLDANGGHQDKKSGEYHYHKSPGGTAPTTVDRESPKVSESFKTPIATRRPPTPKRPSTPYIRRGPAKATGGWSEDPNEPGQQRDLEEEIPGPPPGDTPVYRSKTLKEYHWSQRCPLLGDGDGKALTLDDAKQEVLVGCGLCTVEQENISTDETPALDPIEEPQRPTHTPHREKKRTTSNWRTK